MKSFDVLNRETIVRGRYLLEASAGTGKTFAIENIIVRLLIEPAPESHEATPIDRILAVSFTRAAARDLKQRILQAIHRSLAALKACGDEPVHDFLQAVIESGPEAISKAKERLQQALFGFDQASISTIHSFCFQALRENCFEGNFAVDGTEEGMRITKEELIRLIRDFFRTEIRPEKYSPGQLQRVLKKFKGNLEYLEKELLKEVSKGFSIQPHRNFQEFFEEFQQAMASLKAEGLQSAKVLEDLVKQFPYYSNKPDEATEVNAQRFAQLFNCQEWSYDDFDTLIENGLWMIEAFDPSKRKKRGKEASQAITLHYPQLISMLSEKLAPIVNVARSEPAIFANMAHECQQMIDRYLQQEEKVRFDDFLLRMHQAVVNNPLFADRLRARFNCVIIDEFQDTDPIQWEIFKKLFIEHSACNSLILVGDPKQSIYSFRRADIYTYLAAAKELPNVYSLDTNYRSQPSLVKALNTLFRSEWIPLPQLNENLPYREVKSSTLVREKVFSDSFGSVHFFIAQPEANKSSLSLNDAETSLFFPFIVQEIQRLVVQDDFSLGDFAILVRDRTQSKHLSEFLHHWGIPMEQQHQPNLAESPALAALKEFLKAVLNPYDESALKIALGNEMIGWTAEDVCQLSDINQMEAIVDRFSQFRRHLHDYGFAYCFRKFMDSHWRNDGQSIAEKILRRENGKSFYEDLEQIAALLIEYQSLNNAAPQALLAHLDDFAILEFNEDERLKKRVDSSQDAVKILTIHNSKGLEFPVVFALGLAKRQEPKALLVPSREGKGYVAAIDPDSADCQSYLHENDAEKMRQLYVAMTRAKYRTYIPILDSGSKKAAMGKASPMELFVSQLKQPKSNFGEDHLLHLSPQVEVINEFIQKHGAYANLSSSLLDPAAFSLKKLRMNTVPELVFEAPQPITTKSRWIQSFTMLTQTGGSKESVASAPAAPPHNFLEDVKSPQNLPASALTGVLLHGLLEKIPFQLVKESAEPSGLHEWIAPFLAHSLYQEWVEPISQTVWNAFKVSFKSPCANFSLDEIDCVNSYREMEFIYSCSEEEVNGIKINPGFMKGVIDLVFMHQCKYYIVDWKSNWLGNTLEDYRSERLEAAMHEHDYFLQAVLYRDALKRYLKITEPKAFDEVFGGVFYVFLRGLDPQRSDTGVIWIAP